MIKIETIDLSMRGISLPADRVGMVIAQPYLRLTNNEPYQCTPIAKAGQLAVLSETLAVARAAPHGATKTHFTIFPEYSIPGLDGVSLIDTALTATNWPTGTIVIGGTDGLSSADFAMLAGAHNTHLDTEQNSLARIAPNEWINCCITWIKTANGTVERWLQPKLSPAWPEQNVAYQEMFQGRSVFTFKGRLENGANYRFSTLVCFDWIARVGNQKPWRWVVNGLKQQAAQAQADEVSLSWVFVIQCNRKPSDNSFLTEVSGFFDQTEYPTVRRERACVVFANSAGKASPGRVEFYGCTSLIFSRQTLFHDPTCHSTFSNGGVRFRSSSLLSAYRDVFFRECGACIHSFSQINPNSLNDGTAGKTIALANASVFPLNGIVDPRVPGTAVPACVKWLNDELDILPSLSLQYPIAQLAHQVDAVHHTTITALRKIPAKSAEHAVKLAATESKVKLATGELKYKHADEWEDAEAKAVEHLVHTLDIIGLGFPNPTVGADPAHATAVMNGQMVDLLVISGNTHEECIDHAKTFSLLPRRQVLLVSRDRDNIPWRKKYGSILEIETAHLGQERRITDPQAGTLHLGYERLLNIFRNSPTPSSLQGMINAELVA
ncbi:MAG: hypothetical protein KJ964_02490 [Verrucomicrobia bacterium]|nr:hypothetical protein [Verrucomicrobiota bacterium]MBU1734022.1 hypothetical protein [Verrucomicrobiota bacterium]MBU1857118.1 hypothetical protein [Verrucomicrobiota bacterium]